LVVVFSFSFLGKKIFRFHRGFHGELMLDWITISILSGGNWSKNLRIIALLSKSVLVPLTVQNRFVIRRFSLCMASGARHEGEAGESAQIAAALTLMMVKPAVSRGASL